MREHSIWHTNYEVLELFIQNYNLELEKNPLFLTLKMGISRHIFGVILTSFAIQNLNDYKNKQTKQNK